MWIVIYSFVTYARNEVYSSESRVLKDMFYKNPRSYKVLSQFGIWGGKNKRDTKRKILIAIHNEPRSHIRWELWGMFYELEGKLEKALSAYRKAKSYNKRTRYSVLKEMWILLQMKRNKEAKFIFDKYKTQPEFSWTPDFYVIGFDIAFALKDIKLARKYLITAENSYPDSGDIWLFIGIRWKKLGEEEKFVHALMEAIKCDANCFEAKKELGEYFLEKGRYLDARYYFLDLINSGVADYRVFWGCGYCFSKINMFVMAAEMYKRANRINPENFTAHFNLGTIYLGRFRWWDEGIEELRIAIKNCDDKERIRIAESMIKDALKRKKCEVY